MGRLNDILTAFQKDYPERHAVFSARTAEDWEVFFRRIGEGLSAEDRQEFSYAIVAMGARCERFEEMLDEVSKRLTSIEQDAVTARWPSRRDLPKPVI